MNAIQMTADNSFSLVARGCRMTLRKENDGRWVMYTVNAMVMAYNRGFATPKYFATLEDVERRYKTWRGIAALAS